MRDKRLWHQWWTGLAWIIMVVIAGYISGDVLSRWALAQEYEHTKTCESVVVEIDGVHWEWPSTWLNGPLICYPGEPDARREIVNLDGKTVTFSGSVSALQQLGVVP